MADLSAYVDFSVRLDKSGNTPAIVLTDTSAYPVGVAATVTGVFAATQPDNISLTGNFITPDITLVSTPETPALATLTVNAVGTGGRNVGVRFFNGTIDIEFPAYTKQTSDTTTTLLATHIATAWNNYSGYPVTSSGNVVTIHAASGLGASMNGRTALVVGGSYDETKAQAFIGGGLSLVSNGTVFTVNVNDPVSGDIVIATYTQVSGDTTNTILRDNVINAINTGGSGYTAIPYGTIQLYIVAKAGLGASINTHGANITHDFSSALGTFSGGSDSQAILDATATNFAGGVNADNSHIVNPCSKELRLATDNNFQNGNYTFTYTVKATGYVDTVKTKNFTLTYTPVTTAISDLTNPFDPTVQVIDATKYPIAGFNNPTVTRAWTGYIKSVGSTIQTVSSTAALFDLAYGGNYYDAHYDLAFTALAIYVNTTYTWVSLKDSFATAYQIDAYTPATLNSLRNSLQAMKEQIEAGTYCGGGCGCDGTDYEPYQTAMSLFEGFVNNGQNGLSPYELYPTYEQLLKIFNCSGTLKLTHTNAVIPDYDWGTVVPPFIQHRPIQFIVGGGQQYAPVGGATDYINATLAGYTGYTVYSSADADFLFAGVDFNYKTNGGWSWLGGRTFNTGDKYTLTFS